MSSLAMATVASVKTPSSRMGRPPEFSFAFQPIVDALARTIISYEALVRGPQGEPAGHVMSRFQGDDIMLLDQRGPPVAVALAAALGIGCDLNLNFMPQSLLGDSDIVPRMLSTAQRHGVPPQRIVLEVTEGQVIDDQPRFARLVNDYRVLGLKVAIDDFGAGYSGLNLLAEFQPDQVKLDLNLIRGIESNGPRQAIVRAITQVCVDLGIDVIAEGVETQDEFHWLADLGTRLFQGYLFARPAFASLPVAAYPALTR